jgi:hypothetical protein
VYRAVGLSTRQVVRMRILRAVASSVSLPPDRANDERQALR